MGKKLLAAMQSGEREMAPMYQNLGAGALEFGDGWAHLSFQSQPEHGMDEQFLHGGYYAGVLDMATALAVETAIDEGDIARTVDLNIKMMKAARVGQALIARGQVINISRRFGVAEGRLVDEAGTLYCFASATLAIKRETQTQA